MTGAIWHGEHWEGQGPRTGSAPGPAVVGSAVPGLDAATAGEVRAVVAAADGADGVMPLNEAGLLALGTSAPGRAHVLARDDRGRVVGYGGLDAGHRPAAAEIAVTPDARRVGTGTALVAALRAAGAAAATGTGPVGFWAHGDLPAARALASSAGMSAQRRLARMRRPTGLPLPAAHPPAGVTISGFRPGMDDAAWLRVNGAAFAGHPEQGRWDLRDLRARLTEPWFDPDGFLLAWRGDPGVPDGDRDGAALLGFHWTKLPAGPDGTAGRVGEVYVLGVDPSARAAGLGTALAVAGLRWLAERGAAEVVLWVEADSPAVRLYRRLGFADDLLDVLYY